MSPAEQLHVVGEVASWGLYPAATLGDQIEVVQLNLGKRILGGPNMPYLQHSRLACDKMWIMYLLGNSFWILFPRMGLLAHVGQLEGWPSLFMLHQWAWWMLDLRRISGLSGSPCMSNILRLTILLILDSVPLNTIHFMQNEKITSCFRKTWIWQSSLYQPHILKTPKKS